MSIEPWVRDILRCPGCLGPLEDRQGEALRRVDVDSFLCCAACSLGYPVVDSIPILLSDEAVEL